jgi:ribose transport system substrate-binding protein
MNRYTRRVVTTLAISALAIGACSSAPGGGASPTPPVASAAACDETAKTVGPNGEASTAADKVVLTDAEVTQAKGKNLTMAMLWAGAGPWYNALSAGAKDEAARLGITVTATAEANFDPAKQATDVETAMALKPDIVLTLVVDPTSDQYVSVVTGDHLDLGRADADLMSKAVGGAGSIGYIFHDAVYYVTNNRDREFKRIIECKYPNVKIVAEQGFTEEGKTEAIASAMLTQHPEIKAIYVAWDTAAEGVVAAIRAAGRTDVKVVTIDLGANNDLEMAQGGIVYGKVADRPYEEGQKMVDLAVYKILGKQAPAFVTVPTVVATKETLIDAYHQSFGSEPPADVLKALGK